MAKPKPKSGPEVVAEIAAAASTSIDEFMRRDPKQLSREQKLDMIGRERTKRAQFITDEDRKRNKSDDDTEE